MLGMFKKNVVNPPQELNSPSHSSSATAKKPAETLKEFVSAHPSKAFSISFGDVATLAYIKHDNAWYPYQRVFCGVDDVYCVFLGSLNNLSSLNKQYGLPKGANDAMFIIEAYKALRDRGPYPPHQVLRELEGKYGFLIFDTKAGQVFTALSGEEGIRLYWGIAADGSVIVCDNLEMIKRSCGKSYAPFPRGCMFHSEKGLMSFEHPNSKIRAMPRIDSEGAMCGANFNVDVHSKTRNTIPRADSAANWALGGSQA